MASPQDAVSPPAIDDLSITITPLELTQQPEGAYGGSPFVYTMTRIGDTSGARLVYWHAYGSGDHPTDASDLAVSGGAVSFAPGETSKTITALSWGDFDIEADEGFTVTPYDPASGLDYGVSASGTILNDDTRIAITAVTPALREGSVDGEGAEFLFEVTRRGDLSKAHGIAWTVGFGGGADVFDLAGGVLPTVPSGVVVFEPGETSKTIAIKIAPDTVIEADESFEVRLSNEVGLTDGHTVATATILNDDAAVELRRLSYGEDEGNGGTTAFTFELILSGDTSESRTFSWTVTKAWESLGTYSADAADFAGGVFPGGTVAFAPGETRKTFTVLAAGDTTAETNEDFMVQLGELPPGVTSTWNTAWNFIRNDDPLPVVVHDDAYVTTEGHWVSMSWLQTPNAPGVLGNDIGATAVALGSGPRHGTVTLDANGLFTYKPDAGFRGIDSFTYTAVGPDGYDDGRVTIHVVPVIGSPVTTLDLLALTPEEQVAATYVAFMGRAADADGLAFWIDQFHIGLPTQGTKVLLGNIASSFAISDEAKGLYSFLANPGSASDGAIGSFLEGVYKNLFNRSTDEAGLAYWTGQIRQKLAVGEFVGSVLIDIMGGTQDRPSGLVQDGNLVISVTGPSDLDTLMGKVAVSLEFVRAQQEHGMAWSGPVDVAAATELLKSVSASEGSILVGIKHGDDYVAVHG